LWGVDTAIAADMMTAFAMLPMCQHYPDTLRYGAQFDAIVRAWRPATHKEEAL
jgi:hypothetical protein